MVVESGVRCRSGGLLLPSTALAPPRHKSSPVCISARGNWVSAANSFSVDSYQQARLAPYVPVGGSRRVYPVPAPVAPAQLRRCVRHLPDRALKRTKSRPGFGCSRYVPAPTRPNVCFRAGLGYSRAFSPGACFCLYQRAFTGRFANTPRYLQSKAPGSVIRPGLYMQNRPVPGRPGPQAARCAFLRGIGDVQMGSTAG